MAHFNRGYDQNKHYSGRIYLPTGKGCVHCSMTTHYSGSCPNKRFERDSNLQNFRGKQNRPNYRVSKTIKDNVDLQEISETLQIEDDIASLSIAGDEPVGDNNNDKSTNLENKEENYMADVSDAKDSEDDDSQRDSEVPDEKDESGDSNASNCDDASDKSTDENKHTDRNKNLRCYNCGRLGHISRNCRLNFHTNTGFSHGSARFSGRRGFMNNVNLNIPTCYNCGRMGHFSRDCAATSNVDRSTGLHRGRRPFRRGPSSRPSGIGVIICYNCDGEGHFSRDCQARRQRSSGQQMQQQTRNSRGFNYNQLGHIKANCPKFG